MTGTYSMPGGSNVSPVSYQLPRTWLPDLPAGRGTPQMTLLHSEWGASPKECHGAPCPQEHRQLDNSVHDIHEIEITRTFRNEALDIPCHTGSFSGVHQTMVKTKGGLLVVPWRLRDLPAASGSIRQWGESKPMMTGTHTTESACPRDRRPGQ